MATLGELNVLINAEISDFEAKMARVNQGIGKVADLAKTAGAALTSYITLPLGLLAGAALKAAGDIQALEKGFAATYKGSEDLGTALSKVRELAKLPGLGLKEALQGATNLQAAGFSADLARRALGAFGNALATVGKGKADLDGVGLALSQIASKGKISAEEINQIAERVPQIRKVLVDAFGTADTEALQKLGIGATEFVDKVTTELEKLPKVTGGINNAFENLEDVGTIALARLGDSLNKTFDVEGTLGRLADYLTGLVGKFDALDPSTKKFIFTVAGVAAAIGPLLVAIGTLGAAIGPLSAGFALLTGPVGLVAAAVAGAAVLIVKNWDPIVAYFTTGEGARVFKDLADVVQETVGTIGGVFAKLSSDGAGSLGGLLSALKPIQNIVREIGDGFTAILKIANGVVRGVSALFEGDFKTALAGGKEALDGITLPLRSLFGLVEEKSTVSFSEFFGLVPAPAKEAAAAIQEVSKAVASLNPDQLKALDALEKKLRDNRNASRALGDDYDYLGNKAKILESGIVSLTDVGFAPGGKVVQDYVRQLKAVPEAIDQLTGRQLKGTEKLFDIPDFELKLPDKLELPQLVEPDYIGTFARAAQQIAAGGGAIQDSLVSVNDGVTKELVRSQEAAEMFSDSIGDVLVNGFTNIAVGFGEAIGQIISGASGLEALPSIVLGAIGDLAIQVGQLAIGVGIAVAGIKAALETLNPIVAIAGGIALVALGTAVKGIASNIGKSGGGAGASLGSQPSTSLNTPNVRQQPLQVQVVGELKGRGQDLVAVLRGTDYRESRVN